MRLSLSLLLLIFFIGTIQSQLKVVHWTIDKSSIEGDLILVQISANIEKGWKLYSQHTMEGGPIATSFVLNPNPDFELIGTLEESDNVKTEHSDLFGIKVSSFKKQAVFSQKVKLLKPGAVFSGMLRYMACDGLRCIPPTEESFSISL